MDSLQQQFYRALKQLLPTGWAWPTDPLSNVQRTIRGIAGLFADQHRAVNDEFNEGLPHKTTTRIDVWEQATGLPDSCLGFAPSLVSRRQAITARLQAPHAGLTYDNSSSGAPATLAVICNNAGFNVAIEPYNPFRAGHRCGGRLGRNGRITVLDKSQGGRPLRCLLNRIVPARFALSIVEQ